MHEQIEQKIKLEDTNVTPSKVIHGIGEVDRITQKIGRPFVIPLFFVVLTFFTLLSGYILITSPSIEIIIIFSVIVLMTAAFLFSVFHKQKHTYIRPSAEVPLPTEKVLGSIVGIHLTTMDIHELSKHFYNRWFYGIRIQRDANGIEHLMEPENVVLVTEEHIYFIYVPLKAGDEHIAGGDFFRDYYNVFAQNELGKKLSDMVEKQSLKDIVESDKRNFSLKRSDIVNYDFNTFFSAVTFVTKDNRKYSYAIYAKDGKEKLKNLLGIC